MLSAAVPSSDLRLVPSLSWRYRPRHPDMYGVVNEIAMAFLCTQRHSSWPLDPVAVLVGVVGDDAARTGVNMTLVSVAE